MAKEEKLRADLDRINIAREETQKADQARSNAYKAVVGGGSGLDVRTLPFDNVSIALSSLYEELDRMERQRQERQ